MQQVTKQEQALPFSLRFPKRDWKETSIKHTSKDILHEHEDRLAQKQYLVNIFLR